MVTVLTATTNVKTELAAVAVLAAVGHAEHPGSVMLQLEARLLIVELAAVYAVAVRAITCRK